VARVEWLSADDAPHVVDVLVEAFRDYPVLRFVLGLDASGGAAGPDARLRTLIGFFVQARALRGEPLLGVRAADGALGAAAIASYSDGPPAPPELVRVREATFTALGDDVRSRYETYAATAGGFVFEEPHVHLNMIGVRAAHRGERFGRLLLEAVHAHARGRPGCRGVSLTTETAANVPLYEHFGYEVVAHARVAPDLESWGFFRRVDAGDDPRRAS
jgi:GNAT superfamily N-acetyltransferase